MYNLHYVSTINYVYIIYHHYTIFIISYMTSTHHPLSATIVFPVYCVSTSVNSYRYIQSINNRRSFAILQECKNMKLLLFLRVK